MDKFLLIKRIVIGVGVICLAGSLANSLFLLAAVFVALLAHLVEIDNSRQQIVMRSEMIPEQTIDTPAPMLRPDVRQLQPRLPEKAAYVPPISREGKKKELDDVRIKALRTLAEIDEEYKDAYKKETKQEEPEEKIEKRFLD